MITLPHRTILILYYKQQPFHVLYCSSRRCLVSILKEPESAAFRPDIRPTGDQKRPDFRCIFGYYKTLFLPKRTGSG